ncbi:hypothetical protein CVU76_01040 [Candidatus Dojkabacteria bacterium HGW-Dojkabacteria-1]|uniref:Uncharacterized protein n=1 Tax=Candidatus Dojkabacteria bacterium HGW-Dojkabacteria-1 TaxID=2013761 RepID=A0A2N2F4H6_9BACT|nr:MAG: hypothetical protein CVU76_01040 [Candidatus Dojkabacteria bacterium HGW-Dojkabacteria-1]
MQDVLDLCNGFHRFARKVKDRYDGRDTIQVEDEYDVQDLLYALLHIKFEDVRKEEWNPSYAGSSSRSDFLIKEIETVIEVKKTRKGLEDKEIGEQIIIDIARYSKHPDCKNLICFIYDPEGRIGNPAGLENDLNSMSKDNLNIVTIINPK